MLTGLIFTQFCGNCITLSTIAFQMTLVSKNLIEKENLYTDFPTFQSNGGKFFVFAAPCVTSILQFFMYCFYGNRLFIKVKYIRKEFEAFQQFASLIQGLQVVDSAYQSYWYELPQEYQMLLKLLMARMQQPILLNGFGVVFCNLETFVKVFI